MAVTVVRTRKRWKTELQRLLLAAHLWHVLRDAGLAGATAVISKLDDAHNDALGEIAAHLGFARRLQVVGANGGAPATRRQSQDGAVVLIHGPGPAPGPGLVSGHRTIAIPPLREPDWPYFAAFSRLEAPPLPAFSEMQPSAQQA
jgi:hypothetical protein